MAKKMKAPEEGPHGVDQWSCNGYGLVLGGKKVEPIEEPDIDEIEEE